tara:strand:- start:835 stop:1293 length:459 start_codon:yes stop_codon:yes gene_type:complete
MNTYTRQQRHLFTEKIINVMDTIDEIVFNKNSIMGDGDYLNIMNSLKKLNELKETLSKDIIYVSLARNRQQNRRYTPPPKLVEKLENPKIYTCCNKCDRFVKIDDLDTHQLRAVCLQTYQAKHTTLIKKNKETILHSQTQVLARALLDCGVI